MPLSPVADPAPEGMLPAFLMKDVQTGFIVRILLPNDVQAAVTRAGLSMPDLQAIASVVYDAHRCVRGRLALTVGDILSALPSLLAAEKAH